jgi:hypothetical protein
MRVVDAGMRKLLLGLGLSLVLGVSFGAFPMTSAARCRPAVGFTLARVAGTEGAVAPGGTVLLTLTRVYDADQGRHASAHLGVVAARAKGCGGRRGAAAGT